MMKPVKKMITAAAAAAVVTTITASGAKCQSLFPVRQANQQAVSTCTGFISLYSDIRAHSVGDIVTIIINENTTAASSATLKTARDESASILNGTGLIHQLLANLNLGMSSNLANNGSGATTRTGTLATTLSVVVKQVMPNGNLLVEGNSVMGINAETQRVTITGIIRPADIAPDNTIPSNLVADVHVKYDGKGVVARTQHEGILSRILRFLF